MDCEKFRPRNVFEYPPNNKKTFEEFFFDKLSVNPIETKREYLPIFWTNYYISNNFGSDQNGELQRYLDSLDRTKKYFTIVQYDDNILEDLSDMDILIFSQGGSGKYKDKTYAIPLNCQLPEETVSTDRDILASFIGHIKGRHWIRERMKEILDSEKYLISESTGYNNFLDVMKRSKFSICPRGYGQTSFRIHESLSLGSVPVYVYDEPLIPFSDLFDFNEIGILVHSSDIGMLSNKIESLTDSEIETMRVNGKSIYKKFFEYDGCSNQIINKLKNE